MALEKQTVTLALGTGIDTKNDPKLVSENLLELENAVFTSVGQLKKRYGLTSLGKKDDSGNEIDSAKALTVFQSELGLVNNSSYFSYSESNDSWIEKAKISAVALDSLALIRNNNTQSVPSVAANNGLVVYVYEDSTGGSKATVIDQETGLVLINDTVISPTGVAPKVSWAGNYILVWYVWAASNTLRCRRISNSNPLQFGTAFTVTTDIGNSAIYDISKCGDNNIIVYNTISNQIKVAYLLPTGMFGSELTGYVSPVTFNKKADSIAVTAYFTGDMTNDGIYITYYNATDGTNTIIYDTNLQNTPAIINIDPSTTLSNNITSVNISASQIRIFYEVNAAATYNHYIKTTTITRAGALGAVVPALRSVGLVSKAFIGYDNGVYFVAAHESTYQSTSFLVRYDSTATIINRISYQNSGGLTDKVNSLSNVVNQSTYNWIFPNVIKTKLDSENGIVFSNNGISRTTFNFDTSNLFNTAQLGLNLHICAGMLLIYDGVSLVEAGFNLYPENISAVVDNVSGNLLAGTRQWCVTYEWTDAQGQIHRSAPSIPLSQTTTGGTSNVTLTIPTLRLTAKFNVTIITYRTVASGTVFYRVTPIVGATLSAIGIDTVVFNDNISDSALVGNELLYTTGGVLENIVPPSCTIATVYNNRLVLGGLEDPNEVWVSKTYSANEAVNFSDVITTRIDQGKRGVTSISQLDEKIVYFKENNIYIQVFNGPTSTGINNDIGIPQALTMDTGCISHKSVIFYPNGLIFKSKKGFYQLDRSLQLSYIGAPVDGFNSLTCSGVVFMEDSNQIRFTNTNGVALIYDYYVNQWGVFTNYACVSSKRWNDGYVIARESGIVDKENSNTYLDNVSNVHMRLVTPWIKTAGLQGFQRVYEALLLGQLNSDHNLRVRIGYNYNNYWREDYHIHSVLALGSNHFGGDAVFGESSSNPNFLGDYTVRPPIGSTKDKFVYNPSGESNFGGSNDFLYQFKINNAIQKCQSIRYEFSDYNNGSVEGSCMNLTALTLVVGIKQGAFKIPKIKNI